MGQVASTARARCLGEHQVRAIDADHLSLVAEVDRQSSRGIAQSAADVEQALTRLERELLAFPDP